ncbi:aldo/keto reductase [Microbacterium marmarense]|uniref:Aldo/keto reductase n=1 Tax=Microbacterium marmarense TaxID=3122051 RepID=A0ABU8LQ80_9MICO
MATTYAPELRQQVAEGCGRFSTAAVRDDANASATVSAAYEAGIRVFDSARAYATVNDPFHNESLIASALRGREDAFIMTKGGHFRTGDNSWGVDNSPARLRKDVDGSLRALGRERLDLYFLHRADGPLDLVDAFGTLEELRVEGKIGSIGISNASMTQVDDASTVCQLTAVQNRFVAGDSANEVRRAEDLGLVFFAYSPLGGPSQAGAIPSRFPALSALATARGATAQRLILRGMLAQYSALSVIVGMGSPERARENAKASSEPWDGTCQAAWEADVQKLGRVVGGGTTR